MEKSVSATKCQDEIFNALNKMKEQANTKERELIEVILSMYSSLKDVPQKAAEKITQTATVIDESVHRNPWGYIAAGSAVSFLLGLMSGLIGHRR